MKNKNTKLREMGRVIVCVLLMIILVMSITLTKGSAHNNYTEISALAKSQENEETYIGKDVETTKATPTGTVNVMNVGMATLIENISESIAITCLWDTTVKLTQTELELLYTTVYCEAGNQELEAQIMVAQTILNRILSDKYPDTLRGVVYQRNDEGKPQFAVINWPDFESRGWTEDTMAAVHYALASRGYPLDMLYFRDSYYHKFGQPYKNVGDMYFSTEEVQ